MELAIFSDFSTYIMRTEFQQDIHVDGKLVANIFRVERWKVYMPLSGNKK